MIKKLQNSPDTLVEETIEGFKLLFPENFNVIPGTTAIIRSEKNKKARGKVKIVGGGGSGHEPATHLSVTKNGSDLFVCGDVYAAPSWLKLFQGIEAVDDGSPMLLSVSNHTGDVLNAKLALDMAKAKGIDIRMVINYDDVATAPKGKESERRGLISAIGRIVGISAEQGAPIDEVVRLAKKARDNSRAIGVGMRSAIHPVTGKIIMEMPDDEIEFGIGFHGESSGNRIKMLTSKELAKKN